MIFPKNRFVLTRHRAATLLVAAALTGGLTVAGLAGATPAAAATGAGTSVLAAPGTLGAGKQLISTNGNFRLVMARTGRLELLTRWGRVLWSPKTGTHHDARLRLLAGGKLELVTSAGKRFWSTSTSGKRVRLVLGTGGKLQLMSGKRVLWHAGTAISYGTRDNPAPAARLAAGASLTAGHSLASYKGGYRASMSSNGLFTVTGPGSTLRWSTNSAGWTGSRLTLSRGGNLDLISASGAILWSSHTSGGALLVLGDTGNLALYNAKGTVIWQSAKAARPTLAPAQSTSHYIRSITGAGTDAAVMSALGQQDAAAGNGKRLVVLDIGAQGDDMGDGTQWGVELTGTDTTLTDDQLVSALESYISGYTSSSSAPPLLLAIATNNDNSLDACTGTDGPLGTAGGTEWANVIDQLADYAGSGSVITVAGANDIEPGHAGCVDQATAWTTAFAAKTSQPYVFIGSADGCPTALGARGECDYHWTQQNLYDLAYGLDSHSVPVPQIFNTAQSRQWATISRLGGGIAFGGVLTQQGVCGSSCSLDGVTAWNTLANALTTSSTRTSAGQYVTDLRVD